MPELFIRLFDGEKIPTIGAMLSTVKVADVAPRSEEPNRPCDLPAATEIDTSPFPVHPFAIRQPDLLSLGL